MNPESHLTLFVGKTSNIQGGQRHTGGGIIRFVEHHDSSIGGKFVGRGIGILHISINCEFNHFVVIAPEEGISVVGLRGIEPKTGTGNDQIFII